MKNGLVLLAVGLSVAAFAGMMRVKTDVQTMDRERLKLVRERAELRETKRVLEAEWALVASPERLQKLAAGKGYVAGSALAVEPLAGFGGEVSSTVAAGAVSATTTLDVQEVDAGALEEAEASGTAVEAGAAPENVTPTVQ